MADGVRINLVCCTQVICNEVKQGVPQKGIALTYAMALKSAAQGDDVPDWGAINKAILDRWSMAGLERIKKLAWDIARGRKNPDGTRRLAP